MELFSAASAYLFERKVGDISTSCLGIDVQAARVTPTTKFFGVDDDALNGITAGNRALLGMHGFFEPNVVRTGEVVPVGHDAADGFILFGRVPTEGYKFCGISHE